MQRVTVTLDEQLLAELDRHARARGYQNRSEALRDLARAGLARQTPPAGDSGDCVIALAYVYDHHVRELPKRLARSFHHRHDLTLATLHVHLNEERCMEVSVLRGRGGEVRHFAEHIAAERGVEHGSVVSIPVAAARHERKKGKERNDGRGKGGGKHTHDREGREAPRSGTPGRPSSRV